MTQINPLSTSQPPEEVYVFPMSYAQQRLWLFEQFHPGTSVYNIVEAYRIRGTLDAAALAASVNYIIRRHESLRTTFTTYDGEPVQVIRPQLSIQVSVTDLSDLGEAEQEAAAQQHLEYAGHQPFDLANGPLIRSSLLRLNDREHIWIVGMHHIVSDSRSMNVFFREFAVCYEAFASGADPVLEELPIQYADYTMWQREWLAQGVRDKELAYWQKQLDGASPLLRLPGERSSAVSTGYDGFKLPLDLPEDLVAAVNHLSSASGTTPFTTLLAAFAVLLHRYAGETEIVIGIPIANRTRAAADQLIGFFVNLLPLRIDFSGNPSFADLLRRIRETTIAAYTHQDLPFEMLVAELDLERHTHRNPLVNVVFNYVGESTHLETIKGLVVEHLPIPNETSVFDLTMFLTVEGNRLQGAIRYNTGLFGPDAIMRMVGHYQRLLRFVVLAPHSSLSAVELLTEAERQQIIVEWNANAHDLPESSLAEMFAACVAAHPQKIALIHQDRSLTYEKLNRFTNQLAHHLRARGIGPGDRVGLFMKRGIEWIIAVLAVIKAGAAYVPMSTQYPTERLRLILDDAGVTVILTEDDLQVRLPDEDRYVLSLSLDWFANSARSESDIPCEASGESPAYVMYTSGSTGTPKGVLIPHRGIIRLVKDANYLDFNPDKVIAHLSNIAFDAATFEIWGSLLNGGTLVILNRDAALDPDQFEEVCSKHQITTIFLTTALFNHFAYLRPSIFKDFQDVLFGGEIADPGAIKQVLAHDPPQRLINMYGPTETTTFATWYLIDPSAPLPEIIPIGRPVTNTSIFILDSSMNPVPVGIPGELYIGGSGVAHGYLNLPELTREKFVQNPFGEGRLYATGDRARFLRDGNIEFLGRKDSQIKRHGFRIEPDEIESVLRQHPRVRDVSVIARTDGGISINAYAVPEHMGAVSREELVAYAESRLPEFMLPDRILLLDRLPLTPNGKIDMDALPTPEPYFPSVRNDDALPRTDVERRLVGIWADVLSLDPEKISIHDDFFRLGGHSLIAMQLMIRIEKSFSRKLKLATLLKASSVARMAAVLEVDESKHPWTSLIELRPGQGHPLYLIHPGGGQLLHYRDLLKYLPPDLPIYGLQAQGLDGRTAPHTRIEDMAAHYLTELKAHQPEGPYYLCGFSGGGTIAYEIGQRLCQQGEKPLIILIDTIHPNSHHSKQINTTPPAGKQIKLAESVELVRRSISKDLVYLRGHSLRTWLQHGVQRLEHHMEWQVIRRVQRFVAMRSPAAQSAWEPQKRVLWAVREAYRRYIPQPYPGPLIYIRAADNGRPDAYKAWTELANHSHVITLEGHHRSILEGEKASKLAGILTDILRHAHDYQP